MQFIQHDSPIMGSYAQDGMVWVFNLVENPELAAQYLSWLAEGNTPEPWNPEEVE